MDTTQQQVTLEVRLNNTVFKCGMENNKFYNIKDQKPFAVTLIGGMIPTAQGKMTIS